MVRRVISRPFAQGVYRPGPTLGTGLPPRPRGERRSPGAESGRVLPEFRPRGIPARPIECVLMRHASGLRLGIPGLERLPGGEFPPVAIIRDDRRDFRSVRDLPPVLSDMERGPILR